MVASTSNLPTEDVSEFGRTVEDAERLLRRATRCFVFFKTGLATAETAMWEIPKRVVREELKRRSATDPMPCELAPSVADGYWLSFGLMVAIQAASPGPRI